jgi:hypothetical protein
MCNVVGHEAYLFGVQPRKRRAQELRSPPGVERPEALPVIGGDVRRGRRGQVGIVGVGDGVEVGGREPGVL